MCSSAEQCTCLSWRAQEIYSHLTSYNGFASLCDSWWLVESSALGAAFFSPLHLTFSEQKPVCGSGGCRVNAARVHTERVFGPSLLCYLFPSRCPRELHASSHALVAIHCFSRISEFLLGPLVSCGLGRRQGVLLGGHTACFGGKYFSRLCSF